MQTIEIKTLKEAKGILSGLAILQVALALNQGDTVTVVDEYRDIEYVFRPTDAEPRHQPGND